jgi:hypothetical protein
MEINFESRSTRKGAGFYLLGPPRARGTLAAPIHSDALSFPALFFHSPSNVIVTFGIPFREQKTK